MFVTVIVVLISLATVNCGPTPPNVQDEDPKMKEALTQFYTKYCSETDDNILKKLEGCEKDEPSELKSYENDCISKVLNKKGKPSYKDLVKVECDEGLAKKFEKCENDKMDSNGKDLDKKYPNLDETAKKIMFCGLDVYGIKHD